MTTFNTEQMKTDWHKMYVDIVNFPTEPYHNEDKIYQFFLAKFSAYHTALIAEIEGKKREHAFKVFEVEDIVNESFNQGLQTAIDIINQQ